MSLEFLNFKKKEKTVSGQEVFPVDVGLLAKDNVREVSDRLANIENENLLEQKVEEISLPNLTISDLHKLQEITLLKENLLGINADITQEIDERIDKFMIEISDAYSDEELNNCALYHVLSYSDIPENVEHLDLEGDYSIEAFLKSLESEISEGLLQE